MSVVEFLIIMTFLLAITVINVRLFYFVRKKHRVLNDRLDQRLDRLERRTWDAPNVINASAVRSALPRAGGWAASPDFLAELIHLIDSRRPDVVVELGSGLSTIVIAAALKKAGSGRLVSVDHEPEYAALTHAYLAANQVAEIVDLRVGPLRCDPTYAPDVPWYDQSQLIDLEGIDLLVVDGPPKAIHALVRAPALPFFRPRLRNGWCVLLDDADRPGEREILENWRRMFPDIHIRHLSLEKGAALITPSSP